MSTKEKTIEVSERAATRIEAMAGHVEEIGRYFGESSDVYRTTIASFNHAMGRTFSLLAEGGSLSADGTRGLYIITSYGMHVGVVFFPDHEYRAAMVDQTSARMCLAHKRPIVNGNDGVGGYCDGYLDDGFCYGQTCSVPGTWSLHS